MQLRHSDIVETARKFGFDHCGMAPAEAVNNAYASAYRKWLDDGKNAEMHYLENYFEKRMDPRLLVEGCKTVVSVALNYRPDKVAAGIAWYAQGKDYHDLMREKLEQLINTIGGHGRCFVDTAPIPERYWAWRCGLGWIGKHSQLVIPKTGSTFFLGELLIEDEVDTYDQPMPDRCGNCQKCIEACPTGAIKPPSCHCDMPYPYGKDNFDARLCLSYLTIENRGELPDWAGKVMGDTFYGCDRCMRACPHLQVSPTSEEQLFPSEELLLMNPDKWQSLTVEDYRRLFKGSAVKRAKYEGLMRNIKSICNNS